MKLFYRLKGNKPGDGYSWCDECVRWELSDKHQRTRLNHSPIPAQALNVIGRVFVSIGSRFYEVADLITIAHRKLTGEIVEK